MPDHPQHATHHVVPDAVIGLTVARYRLVIAGTFDLAVASGRPTAEVAIVLGNPTGVRAFLAAGEYEQLPALDVVCVAAPRARVAAALARSCAACAARFAREAARGVPLHIAVGANAVTVAIVDGSAAPDGPAINSPHVRGPAS